MGFYGNIQNFNKISLQFDLIYPSRFQMDNSTALDGVFLGRYVAIDYGEMPITGYYNTDDKQFYTVRENQNAEVRIEAQTNKIYQDIGSGEPAFYYWDKSGKYVKIQNSSAQLNSSYVQNYHIDVNNYGAAYDGTVWQKTYDPATNKYKYVLVAELNAKTPSFHLVVDKPTNVPVTPYFDRDSTNMDYYLHMAPSYGHRIKKISAGGQSDEKADHYEIVYTNTGTTNVNWREETEEVDGDIYYNKAGFDDTKRTYSDTENTINYEYAKSGRIYGQQDAPIFVEGAPENDTYDWFFRIPALGNAVCSVWDKLYGYNKDTNDRFIELSQKQDDTESHLVTYSRDTIYGTVNELRDALGYKFIDAKSVTLPDTTEDKNEKVKVTNTYIRTGASESIEYKLLDSIFYEDQNDGTTDYYFYRYKPIYETASSVQEGKTYYVKPTDDDVYVLANLENFNASDRNGKPIDPLYTTYYTRKDRWIKSRVKSDYNYNNVYGLINTLWHLIGTHAQDERSLDTVYGAINYIKDIVSNINLNLSPGKMLHVNDKGVIETTGTYYPSSTTDANRVLVGNPNESESKVSWENRVRKIGVVEPDTSEIAWDIQTGTIDTNANNNNVVNFKAGNKWIGLHADTGKQLIQVLHTKSDQAEHDFNEDVVIDDDLNGEKTEDGWKDCPITLPFIITDNAGHITGYDTKTFYIPHNFRNIALTTQSIDENEMAISTGTMEPESVNDTFTFATGNQWIRAKIDEDQITFAHALINKDSTKNWEFKVTAEDGWQLAEKDDNKITIPTFVIDNAGHVVDSGSVDFYIPHNFRDIHVVTATEEDVDAKQIDGKLEAGNTVDNWSIASQNKWLRVAANSDDDKITIGHSYSSQAEHDFDTDVEIASALDGSTDQKQKDNKIVLPVLKTDNAGHVIGYSTNTFYIPHNFKSIIVQTDNDIDINSTQADGTLTAGNITDTWTIAPQNKWIDIAAESINNKITIGHKYSEETNRDDTGDTIDQTPKFGATFKIPNYKTDNAGHIVESKSHTVQIPQNSYTQTEDKAAGVLTTMSLDESTGAFDATRVNVGTLALTEYVYDANNTEAIKDSDSINNAFSKVEAQIAKEVTDRGNAVSDLNDNITATITAMNERLAASDNDLSTRLTNEATTRESEDRRILGVANTYTDTKVADLINSAPGTLDTLQELAKALGNDDNFATTVSTKIGDNTTAINAEKDKIDAHIATKTNNPHEVTASQIGLGNVDNESKTTMFTNPEFTGVPIAPTATAGTSSDQIATTKFVTSAIETQMQEINTIISNAITAFAETHGLTVPTT